MRSSLSLVLVLAVVCWSYQYDLPNRQHRHMQFCLGRPKAHTNEGTICGVTCPDGPVEVCGKPSEVFTPREYLAFAGIPFARPPVNDLRFKSPVKITKQDFQGMGEAKFRDGGWMPPLCPQLDMMKMLQGNLTAIGEEDCLYLNVYIPKVDHEPEGGFPVMVWIHGGGFTMGGIQEYYADKLMTRDVILVSIQYRLGILGWMSTGDDVAPGNLALKDQEMALRWVQDNIINFVGNPNKVTIFGESAGGISVHHQILNPGAKGLFSRAIMQSGTALMDLYPEIDQREQAFKIASRLGCDINNDGDGYNSEELLNCLQNIPAVSFVNIALTFVEFGFAPAAFSPRYGEATIPASPGQLLREGKYNMVDVMMGINQHEGGLLTKGMYTIPNAYQSIATNFSNVGHHVFNMEEYENDVAAQIFQYYMGEIREYGKEDADILTEMFGDYTFDMPHDYSVELHSRDSLYGKNVYAYELKYKGSKGIMSFFGPADIGEDYVNHGDDLNYLFKFDPAFFNLTMNDPKPLKVEKIMLDLWTNFATYGNPTPDRSLGFTWAPVNLKSTDHLVLGPEPYMESDTRGERRKVYKTFNISINQDLFPDRIGAGANWKPWRTQDQMQC